MVDTPTVKITALPPAGPLLGPEVLPMTQAGVTKKMSLDDLMVFVNATFAQQTVVIDPHQYGAKGGALSYRYGTVTNLNTLSLGVYYTFTDNDIGKLAFVEGQELTIIGVSGGNAILSGNVNVGNGTNRQFLIGYDDTAAFAAAFAAAKRIGLFVGNGAVSEQAWSGGMPYGGVVQMRNTGYMVRNSQASWDAGKQAAIVVPRRCGLVGQGMGQTHIYLMPGNIGHCITNENSGVGGGGWDDFMHLSEFSLYGNHGYQPSGCLDGIYFKAAFNNYFKVDNFMCMHNLRINECKRDCLYISGRGEGVYFNIFCYNAYRYGMFIDGYVDSRFFVCNAGGNFKTGIRINRSAAIHLTNCKSFYSGASGGNVEADCANFAFLADSYLNGQVVVTGCESQEARGSGFYIQSGLNQFTGCLSSDPGRSALIGGTPPAIRAGFHLAGNNTGYVSPWYNIFTGCYVRPSLELNFGNPGALMYNGTHAVYINDNARGNCGTIYTFAQASYTNSKLGGPGITNRLNGELSIDGNFLPSDWPSAPTITSVVYQPSTAARVTFTAPASNGGRAVRDYTVEYKLTADSVWQKFTDSMSDALFIDITGLTDGQSYDFRAYASNANGAGAYSAVYTYTHQPSAPFAIADLMAIAGTTKAFLSWTAPVNGGSAITDYIVQYKLTSEPTTWTTFSDGTSTATTATVTGLTNDSSYDFRVLPVNAIGTGAASNIRTATPLISLATLEDASMICFINPELPQGLTSANGTTIESINDLCGRGWSWTQTTELDKPTKGTHTINGLAAVGYDGVRQYVNANSNLRSELPNGDFTLFIPFQIDATGLNKTNAILSSNGDYTLLYSRNEFDDVVCKAGGTSDASRTFPTSESNPHIAVMRRSGSSLDLYIDGNKASLSANAADQLYTSLIMGRVNAGYGQLDGAIGVCPFYGSALLLSKCNQIGPVLAAKYGITWVTMT